MKRIAAMKKFVDDMHLELRLFCLTPILQNFNKICACTNLRRQLDGLFDIWATAAAFKYDFDYDGDRDFIALDEELCRIAIENPTRSNSIKLMHVFYATGELKYIDLFYQMIGHKKTNTPNSRFYSDLFNKTRDEYSMMIPKLLQDDPEHFSKYDVELSGVDFSYFAGVKESLGDMKDKRADWKGLFNKIADENN